VTNNDTESLRKVFECSSPVKDQLADAAETSFSRLKLKHKLLHL